MRRFLALCVAVCVALSTASAVTEPMEPTPLEDGIYHVSGEEEGKAYSGVFTIRRDGESYLTVHVTAGGAISHGVGVRKGNVLSVSIKQTFPPTGAAAAMQFDIKEKEKLLDGVWVVPGADKHRIEQLRFLRRLTNKDV